MQGGATESFTGDSPKTFNDTEVPPLRPEAQLMKVSGGGARDARKSQNKTWLGTRGNGVIDNNFPLLVVLRGG